MGRVVSFELNSQHPEEAAKFYSKVFGWKIGQPRWDYWPVTTGEEETPGVPGNQGTSVGPNSVGNSRAPGIDGGIVRGPSDYPHGIRITIEVDDIDAVVAKAVENGAKVVRAKMEFDEFYLAYLVDPVGLVIGLMQTK